MSDTLQYYDLVLAAVATSMVLGAAVGLATSVALPTAVTVAGVVAAALVGHALFLDVPVDEAADLTDEADGVDAFD